MSELICVTNRRLCAEDFLVRLKKIAEAKPGAVVLREKDLSGEEYLRLARQAKIICEQSGTRLILHNFSDVAAELGADSLHLPLPKLRELTASQRGNFKALGTSCHSVENVIEAQIIGCTYVFAGHIFETDCKRGIKGRGLEFLSEVCARAEIPVYAIGGISPQNYKSVIAAGASGACVMSGFMRCESPLEYIKTFSE